MELSDLDCSIFQFDPSKGYELNKLIKSHSDFQVDLGGELKNYKRTILRYIILYYDKNTPLRIIYSDEFKRKREAAIMAGFRIKRQNKMTAAVEDILLCQNPLVNKMIVRYVMSFHNQDYLRLIIFSEMMGRMAIRKMESSDIKPADIKAINELSEGIESLHKKIFGGQESKELKEQLYKTLEEEQLNLHPDSVAKELSKNPDLFKDMGRDMDEMKDWL